MNDPQERLSDERIEDLLAPLRAVKLPDGAHAANRDAVRRALSRRVRLPWWRRTVAVPVPVAIAASLGLAFTTVVLALSSLEPRHADDAGAGPTKTETIAGNFSSFSNFGADYAPESPRWSVSRSYIQSLESLARARAFLTIDLEEKRDES